jgi:hypothetical protein
MDGCMNEFAERIFRVFPNITMCEPMNAVSFFFACWLFKEMNGTAVSFTCPPSSPEKGIYVYFRHHYTNNTTEVNRFALAIKLKNYCLPIKPDVAGFSSTIYIAYSLLYYTVIKKFMGQHMCH